jgi:hypothetical protein
VQFAEKGVKVAALSCDVLADHNTWLEDVVAHCENKVTIGEGTCPARAAAMVPAACARRLCMPELLPPPWDSAGRPQPAFGRSPLPSTPPPPLASPPCLPADFPIIADPSREIATLYGMLDPNIQDKEGLPLTCRAVFIIGPDKKLKLVRGGLPAAAVLPHSDHREPGPAGHQHDVRSHTRGRG